MLMGLLLYLLSSLCRPIDAIEGERRIRAQWLPWLTIAFLLLLTAHATSGVSFSLSVPIAIVVVSSMLSPAGAATRRRPGNRPLPLCSLTSILLSRFASPSHCHILNLPPFVSFCFVPPPSPLPSRPPLPLDLLVSLSISPSPLPSRLPLPLDLLVSLSISPSPLPSHPPLPLDLLVSLSISPSSLSRSPASLSLSISLSLFPSLPRLCLQISRAPLPPDLPRPSPSQFPCISFSLSLVSLSRSPSSPIMHSHCLPLDPYLLIWPAFPSLSKSLSSPIAHSPCLPSDPYLIL